MRLLLLLLLLLRNLLGRRCLLLILLLLLLLMLLGHLLLWRLLLLRLGWRLLLLLLLLRLLLVTNTASVLADRKTLCHRHHLNTTNDCRLPLLQCNYTVPLFLLAASQLFPSTPRFVFGDGKLLAHLGQLLLDLGVGALVLDSFADGLCTATALFLDGSLQHRLNLGIALHVATHLKEPALELALRAGPQSLELDHGVEEVGSGGRQICHLSRELPVQRILVDLL